MRRSFCRTRATRRKVFEISQQTRFWDCWWATVLLKVNGVRPRVPLANRTAVGKRLEFVMILPLFHAFAKSANTWINMPKSRE